MNRSKFGIRKSVAVRVSWDTFTISRGIYEYRGSFVYGIRINGSTGAENVIRLYEKRRL